MLKSVLVTSAMLAMAGMGLAQAKPDDGNKDNGNKHHTIAAPEIDPAGAIGALTLLAGGLAVIRGRRTK